MKLAFMGTPEFAVKALAELVASGHEVVCVYSQPPNLKAAASNYHPHLCMNLRKAWALRCARPHL